MQKITTGLAACLLSVSSTTAIAQNGFELGNNINENKKQGCLLCGNPDTLLSSPAGIGADHMHEKGSWMVSYQYMQMMMSDMRDGTTDLSAAEIALNVSNPFGPGGGNTRVVPDEMTMDMHMLMGMYAPTEWVTVMVMAHYIYKEMNHTTFAGASGDTILGEFTTASSGIGDTHVSGIFELYQSRKHSILGSIGVSLPTGSITEEDDVLAPTNTRPRFRLPYAMQLGSGTYDLLPQLTYTGKSNNFSWGGQYNGVIRTGRNNAGYTLGDKHSLDVWGAYKWHEDIASSIRLTAETEDSIDGQDDQITAPVTTADPENYGGERLSFSLGTNYLLFDDNVIGVEATIPLYQDLNGPQMERDYSFRIQWQKSF